MSTAATANSKTSTRCSAEAERPVRASRAACRSRHAPGPCSVLVVPADPQLKRVALVPPFGRPVEDPVVAHQELDAASPGPVGLVHGALVEDERAEALTFREV